MGRFSDLKGYELCENVVYLGEHGCFTTREGMTIAYLSGRQQGGDSIGILDGLNLSLNPHLSHRPTRRLPKRVLNLVLNPSLNPSLKF